VRGVVPALGRLEGSGPSAALRGILYQLHHGLGAVDAGSVESAVALNKLLDHMPRYAIVREGLRRVAMTNVIGWNNVPVRVLG